MTVRTEPDGTIVLEGRCPIEDAETVARLLSLDPAAAVDWRSCEHAHTAVVQVLLAIRPPMRGPPGTATLRNWIEPMLLEGLERLSVRNR
jgi:hypothetical protein